MNSREKSLTTFALIGDFVQQLSIFFDVKSHLKDEVLIKLALYERLIEKTGPTNIEQINRHLSCFSEWVNNNMNACVESNLTQLNDEYENIMYSENVFLPLNALLRRIQVQQKDSGKDVLTLMWKHIINIGYKLNPTDQLKERLIFLYSQNAPEIKHTNSGRTANREEELIDQTINDIKQELDSMGDKNVTNVKDVIVHMTKSGAFEKMLDNFTSCMDNEDINVGKMLNIVMSKAGNGKVDVSGLSSVMKMMGANMGNAASGEEESKMFEDFDDTNIKRIEN